MSNGIKIISGWFIITIAYIAVFAVFGQFVTYDSNLGVTNYEKSPFLKPVLGALLTIIPYMLAGLYCRIVFKGRPLMNVWLVSFIPSLGDKLAIYLLSALIYEMNPLAIPQVMYRINSGGDQTAPFFTDGYIVLSIVFGNLICILFASLFQKRDKR